MMEPSVERESAGGFGENRGTTERERREKYTEDKYLGIILI